MHPEPIDISDTEAFKNLIDTLSTENTHSNPLYIQSGIDIRAPNNEDTVDAETPFDTFEKPPRLPNTQNWAENSKNTFHDTTIDLSNYHLIELNKNDYDPPQIYWLEITNQQKSDSDSDNQHRRFNIILHGQIAQTPFNLKTFIKHISEKNIILYPHNLDQLQREPEQVLNRIRELQELTDNPRKTRTELLYNKAIQQYRESNSGTPIVNMKSRGPDITELTVQTQLGKIDLHKFDGILTHTFQNEEIRTVLPHKNGIGQNIIVTLPKDSITANIGQLLNVTLDKINADKEYNAHVYSVPTFVNMLENMQLTLCTRNKYHPKRDINTFTLPQAVQKSPQK